MARRQFRSRNSYARRGPTREPYDSVLIVCEGGKTEPLYFEGLKAAHRLSSANIDIRPMGRDPLSLVDHALSELESVDAPDRAYCVFDRDTHATFGDAVRKAQESKAGRDDRLRLAISIPCFEVWPLLHFGYSTAPIMGGGGKTPGEQACAALAQAMAGYSKNDRSIFEKLAPMLPDALRHAGKLSAYNRQSDSDNPSTNVHELVEYLIGLKR